MLQIEEFDKVPSVAQVAVLTLLDDLPDHTCCIATSNHAVSEFEERIQSRFMVCEVAPPTASEILTMLRLRWPSVPKHRLVQIAEFSCGNVRQALTDMDNACSEFIVDKSIAA